MELRSIRVDCSGVFEYGQCYVALSRCIDAENMRIIHFHRRYIKTHPRVHHFVNELTEQLQKSHSHVKRRKRAKLCNTEKETEGAEIATVAAVLQNDEPVKDKENIHMNAQTARALESPQRKNVSREEQNIREMLVPETPKEGPGGAYVNSGIIPETPEDVVIPDTPKEARFEECEESPTY